MDFQDRARKFALSALIVIPALFGLFMVFHGIFTGSWTLIIMTTLVIIVAAIALLAIQGAGNRVVIFIVLLLVLGLIGKGALDSLAAESLARQPAPVYLNEVTQMQMISLFVPSAQVTWSAMILLLAIGAGVIVAAYLESVGKNVAMEVVALIIGVIALVFLLAPHRATYTPAILALSNDVFWYGTFQAFVWSLLVSVTVQLSGLVENMGTKGIWVAIASAIAMPILYSTAIVGVEHGFYSMAVRAVISGLPVDDVFTLHMGGKYVGLFGGMVLSSIGSFFKKTFMF